MFGQTLIKNSPYLKDYSSLGSPLSYSRLTHQGDSSQCSLFLPGLPGSGSTIKDYSPNKNDGTITGATWVRLPSGLWVLTSDGTNDYVDMGHPDSLDLTTKATIEFWAKFTAPLTTGTVISKGTYAAAGKSWCVQIQSDGTLALSVEDTDFAVWGGVGSHTTGVWYHRLITIDTTLGSANMKVYSNGVYVSAGNRTTAIPVTTDPVRIGTESGGSSDLLGIVGLVKIDNIVASATQVAYRFAQRRNLFGV